jgi:hypothetical protein
MSVLDFLGNGSKPKGALAEEGGTAAQLPFEGYERIDSWDLIHKLSEHSQVELEAVEAYERAHENRPAVFDKLRYLRGPEPLPNYDALDVEQILPALGDADDKTLKKIRGYERKFAKRPEVLETVASMQRDRRSAKPAAPVPAYQPQSAPRAG